MADGRSAILAAAFLLLLSGSAAAQTSLPQARITAKIDEAQVVPMKGNVHPMARPQNDQGVAAPAMPLNHITMMLRPTVAQQADLDALLAAQQNPTSPQFHQWLTPQQYGDRFGVAPADLAKVTAWLVSQGFAIVDTPASRNAIIFSGTAGQVAVAFHTEIHNYAANGRKFFANSAEPSVPAAIAGLVAGFHGLNNVRLKPRAVPSKPANSVKSQYTSSVSGFNYISPGDFATIYDLNPLYSSSPAINGAGEKIAIVGQSNIVLADIAKFRQLSGLPANVPNVTFTGTTDPGIQDGDVQESSLDIEWSGAVARGATINFVYGDPINGGGIFDALQHAISQGNSFAQVISISYGACEAMDSASDIDFLVALAQQANAQGMTITSSSGDGGATDCDASLATPNYPAQLGLNVDFPGSMPYITAVGGTEFDEGNGAYWKPANGTDVVSSALSYIPEKVWNDTNSQNGLNATGGGASSIFGKPSWQTGTGVPSDGARDVPDVSIDASDGHDPYLVCTQI
ncbi:MAG: S53 family peptidase, partial [Candidatus Acidiferrales bacterium]